MIFSVATSYIHTWWMVLGHKVLDEGPRLFHLRIAGPILIKLLAHLQPCFIPRGAAIIQSEKK